MYIGEAGGRVPSVAPASGKLAADVFSPSSGVLFRHAKSKEISSLGIPIPEPASLFGTYIYQNEAGDSLSLVSFASRDIASGGFPSPDKKKKNKKSPLRKLTSESATLSILFLSDEAGGSFPSVSFSLDTASGASPDKKKSPFRKLTSESATLSLLFLSDEAGGSFPFVSSFFCRTIVQ
ncbi:MAG: hypothetical protein LBD35_05900 [Prevotellaceae bacterium]|jgi:hypothetical protein|nr:hypothetical protein [Prevotellaceae bacterium]